MERMTNSEFIKKAKLIHCDEYDYSLTDYKSSYDKVKIICKIHGVFEQHVHNHLKGSRCKYCNINNKLNTDIFIDKAKLIHNNKYDYSLSKYINSFTKIKIICPIHGEFEQRPNGHLSQKQGCGKCDGKYKTTQDFISEANSIHNGYYDYTNVIYINSKTKVKIICPIHDEFEQIPNTHLRGGSCFKCSDTKYSNDEFIEKSKLIHDDKYDYSLVEYINNKTKVKIICPIHGIFEQVSSSHLCGSGCPRCFGRGRTINDFINESKLKHGDKYDYSLSVFKNIFSKIRIICPIHGEFTQCANNHLRGKGCSKCRESKGEKKIRNFLNEKKIDFISQKKFTNCRDINKLSFDFYIPKINTCIEYDGRQHYMIIDKWDGEEGLLDQQKKDEIKNKYCVDNNIKLIRISYKDDIILELNKILTIL